jgi:hypothetical protein
VAYGPPSFTRAVPIQPERFVGSDPAKCEPPVLDDGDPHAAGAE